MLALLDRIIQKFRVFVFFWLIIFPSVAISGVFTFDKVDFQQELNGGKIGSWSQLIFEVKNPRVDGRSYLGREKIRFSIDTDLAKNYNRTAIRFNNSWLTSRVYQSRQKTEAYIGSGKLSGAQKSDLATLTVFERTALAWIIVNSDELIAHALNSSVNVLFAPLSRPHWSNYLSKGVFEKNLRKNFGLVSEIRYLIRDHDDYAKHNKFLLKNKIQPGLVKLGYYRGAIDGLIGPATITAIKKLEKNYSVFPDGILIDPRELNFLAGGLDDLNSPLMKKQQLQNVSSSRPLLHISAAHFPNYKTPNTIQDIKVDISFKWLAKDHFFKINGHYDKINRVYTAADFCFILNEIPNTESACIDHSFYLQDAFNFKAYLKTIAKEDLNRERYKCKIVQDRYSEILKAISENEFITRLYESKRTDYILGAKRCIEYIDELKLGGSVIAENNTANGEADTLRSQVEKLKKSFQLKSILVDQITKQKDIAEKASTARQEVAKQLSLDIRRLETHKELQMQTIKRKNEQILFLEEQVSIAQSNSDNGEVSVLENEIKSVTGNLNKLLNKYDAQTIELNDAKTNLSVAMEQAVAYGADQTELELALKEKVNEISALTLEFRDAENLSSKLQSTLSSAEAKLKDDAAAFKIRIADLEAKVASLTTELSERTSLNVEPPKGFILSEDWFQYKQWITPSQMRFCSILHEYEIAKQEAASSGNQLLQNIAIRDRDSDVAALLNVSRSGQDGFRSWVSVVESVFAMDAMNPSSGKVELAAGVILKTPCNVTLGTGRVIDQIGNAASEFKYLAFDGDLIFSQLTSVRRGDPVLFDGTFERSKTGASEMFVTNKLGKEEKLEAYDRPADAPDMFVNITYLAKL
tara:strand:+ start:53 stop:2650 length:2598 start_codon:yes stop_codon:yes gene_type:complete